MTNEGRQELTKKNQISMASLNNWEVEVSTNFSVDIYSNIEVVWWIFCSPKMCQSIESSVMEPGRGVSN